MKIYDSGLLLGLVECHTSSPLEIKWYRCLPMVLVGQVSPFVYFFVIVLKGIVLGLVHALFVPFGVLTPSFFLI